MLGRMTTLALGTALLLACQSGDRGQSEEAAKGPDADAPSAEGGAAAEQQPAADPSQVPVEVSYDARLLFEQNKAGLGELPEGGRFKASGTGTCQVDEEAGTWRINLKKIDEGNLRSFELVRRKPQGAPHSTMLVSAGHGDLEIFHVTNDGKTFLDKAVMSVKRSGDGATVQFDAETSLKSYAIKGTAKCAKLSPR